jgi:hypothetical protein
VASTAHAATIIRVVFVIENIIDEETKCEPTQIEEEKQTKTTGDYMEISQSVVLRRMPVEPRWRFSQVGRDSVQTRPIFTLSRNQY